MDVWFVLRAVNIMLYGGILSALIAHWRTFVVSPYTPGARWWLWAVLAAGMYSSAETAFLKQPGGFRVAILTLALGGLFFSLYAPTAVALWRRFRKRYRDYRAPQRTDVQ